MTGRQYLEQVYDLDKLIEADLLQLSLLRKKMGLLRGLDYSKEKVQSSGENYIENSIVRLCDLEREINEKIDQFVDLKKEIRQKIDELPDQRDRVVLIYRYLCFLSWEAIAFKMGYSSRNIHRVHTRALYNFETWHSMSQGAC